MNPVASLSGEALLTYCSTLQTEEEPGYDVTGLYANDGLVNGFDIDQFVLALTDPSGYAAAYPDCEIMLADCNGDGAVDSFDIDPFVELLTGP